MYFWRKQIIKYLIKSFSSPVLLLHLINLPAYFCICSGQINILNHFNRVQTEVVLLARGLARPAFFALIWNNEVGNKVYTLRLHSVRSAAKDEQRSPAIGEGLTSGLTAILLPTVMWMLSPHAASKAPQEPPTSGAPIKNDLNQPLVGLRLEGKCQQRGGRTDKCRLNLCAAHLKSLVMNKTTSGDQGDD